MFKKYKVTHSQKRFDGPDDAPVETIVTVRPAYGHDGWVSLSASKLGCSRDFMVGDDVRQTEQDVIRRWVTSEHAQTVHSITLIEE